MSDTAYQARAEWMSTITDDPFATRTGAKARARKSGPRTLVSTFDRISSSEWLRIPGEDTEAPALLISTVTSGAAATASAMDAPSVTSRVRGTMRSIASEQIR